MHTHTAILHNRHPALEENERTLQILLTQIHFPHLNPSAFQNKSLSPAPAPPGPIEIKSPFTIEQRKALKKRCPRRTPAPSYDHLGSPGGEAKKATICDLVMLMPGPMMEQQWARRNVNEALFNTGRTHNPKLGGGKSIRGHLYPRMKVWWRRWKGGVHDNPLGKFCHVRSWMRQTAVREHVDVLRQNLTKA